MVTNSNRRSSKYVICVNNDGVEASLDISRVYEVLPDRLAKEANMIRVIDNEQEDYLYPHSYFVPITMPKAAETAIRARAEQPPAKAGKRATRSKSEAG
jgi:hypothetical protein